MCFCSFHEVFYVVVGSVVWFVFGLDILLPNSA